MKRTALMALCSSALLCAGFAHAEDAKKTYVEPKLTHAPYGEVKIVVPITSPDYTVWMGKMGNIGAALKAAESYAGRLKIKVVTYSSGVELLAQKDNAIAGMIKELRGKGVQFEVCNNTLKGRDIDFHTLNGVTDEDVVPAGFLEVGWLQTQGYVVDPVN